MGSEYGVLPCPYLGGGATNDVLTPGKLIAHHGTKLGVLTYQWYEWSATCNLEAAPAPVTKRFKVQVWWLAKQGVAFVDATGYTQADTILASVRVTRSTAATTTTVPFPSTTTTTSPAEQLPFSVQSDTQMQEAGDGGPTSSILVPTSCELNGTTVTATGGYQGGYAPYVYGRFGDYVELYVYTAPMPGYSQGIMVGLGGVGRTPPQSGATALGRSPPGFLSLPWASLRNPARSWHNRPTKRYWRHS